METSIDVYDLDAQDERKAFLDTVVAGVDLVHDRDLETLLRQRFGRRIVYRLLELAGLWRTSWEANAMAMAHNEGKKNLGYWLLDQIMRLAPDVYPLLLKEHEEDERIIADAARS